MSVKVKRYGKILVLVMALLTMLVLAAMTATWTTAQSGTFSGSNIDPNDQDGGGVSKVISRTVSEVVSGRNYNHRIWQVIKEVETVDPKTRENLVEKQVSQIVEVGCGICYRDEADTFQVTDCRWQASEEGFVMDTADYQLQIGRTAGSQLRYTIDGDELLLCPVSIKAFGGPHIATIAEIDAEVEGVIDPCDGSRLVFAVAFGDGIDLVLQVKPDGYHQDVIFHKPLILPEYLTENETNILLYTELSLDDYCQNQGVEVFVGRDEYVDVSEYLNTSPTLENIEFAKIVEEDGFLFADDRFKFVASEVYDADKSRCVSAYKQLFRDERGRTCLVETLSHDFFQKAEYPVVWDYETSSGTMTEDETWYANVTYYLSSDVTIGDESTLRIEPGTFVKFNDNTKLTVSGTGKLIARGKPGMQINFTSKHDNYNGEEIDGSSGNFAIGDYVGLEIGDDSEIEFCTILFAQTGLKVSGVPGIPIRHSHILANSSYGIEIDPNALDELDPNETLLIFNNEINGNGNAHIKVTGSQGQITIRNNTFAGGSHGIYIDEERECSLTIENNIFFSVGTTGIYYDPCANDPNFIYNDYNGYYNTYPCNIGVTMGDHDVCVDQTPFFSEAVSFRCRCLNKNQGGGGEFLDAGSCSVTDAGYDDPCQWAIHHVQEDPCYYFGTYSTTTYTTDTVWQPNYQVCDMGTVSLGFHYPRIDYLVYRANVVIDGVGEKATLTIMPGTVIAHRTYGTGPLKIENNGALICKGDPYEEGYVTFVEWGRAGNYWTIGVPYSNYNPCIECKSGSEYDLIFTRLLGLGGALKVDSGSSGNVSDCEFRLNTLGFRSYSNVGYNVENCLLVENKFGLENRYDSDGRVAGCTFDRNNYGIYNCEAIEVRNCLFSYNQYALRKIGDSATCDESYNVFYCDPNMIPNYEFSQFGDLDPCDWADPNTANAYSLNGDPFNDSWIDFADRFHLAQDSNDYISHAVDNGYDPCNAGMVGYTTNIKGGADTAPIDIGYHYPLPNDTDGDGLRDYDEYWFGTDHQNIDSDGDGLIDGFDGFITVEDYLKGIDLNGDGYVDGELDPNLLTDPAKADTDEDGMPDGWEYQNSLNPLVDDADGDVDGDGLSNLTEYTYNLDPQDDNEGDIFTDSEYDTTGSVILERQMEIRGGKLYISETRNEYDINGRIWRKRQLADPDEGTDDSDDRITLYQFDVRGNIKKTVQKGPGSTNPNAIDPNNDIVTENFYDSLGRLIRVEAPENKTVYYTYYNGGQLESSGQTTNYYDAAGRVEKVVDAEGHYRTLTYDSLGHTIKNIACDSNDVALMQTRSEYDGLGHVTRRAVMFGAYYGDPCQIDTGRDMVIDYEYDPNSGYYPGMLVSQTRYYGGNSAKEAVTSYYYDELGRRDGIEDPCDNETALYYDAAGRVSYRQQIDSNPLGNDLETAVQYAYDPLGRQIQQRAVADPCDSETDLVTSYVYDARGNILKMTKPNGIYTSYKYNNFGQRIEMTADPCNIAQKTEWAYDRLGRQTSITGYAVSQTAQATGYEYNKLGLITKITYPDDETIEYSYDPNGHVLDRTDQRGWVTEYEYDKLGHMLEKYCTVDNITTECSFTYDGLGRMLTAEKEIDSNAVSSSEFTYSDFGKTVMSSESLFGGTAKEISYQHDQMGNLVELTYPDDDSISITRNPLGRIAAIANPNETTVVEYKYIGSRVARRKYPVPDVKYDITYDNYGRAIQHYTYTDSNDIADFLYAFDDNGNITSQQFDHRAADPCNIYTYDDIDRLTKAVYLEDPCDIFVYDDLSNRTGNNRQRDEVVNYSVDSLTNRYNSVGGNNLSYDDAGNMTQDKDGYDYEYDYENRLIKVMDDQQNVVAEYAYDALGRRIRKIDRAANPDETTLYYYNDNWQVLSETDENGTQQRDYIYGNYIDEVLLKTEDGDDLYYAHNHIYSVVALIDDQGNVVERYEYDAYGKPTIYNAGFSQMYDESQYDNSYMFTGRRYDPETGNYYYRHREFDTYTGRFLQHDPIGYIDGLNLYEAFKSNSILYTDPFGLVHYLEKNAKMRSMREKVTVGLDPGDTEKDVARFLGLDYKEMNKWARKVKCGYLVPNTAYIDVDDYQWAWLKIQLKYLVSEAKKSYKKRGWHVVYSGPEQTTRATVLSHMKSTNIIAHVVIAQGDHDNKSGAIQFEENGFIMKIPPRKYTRYGINRMSLVVCYSNKGVDEWVKNISVYGRLLTVKSTLQCYNWKEQIVITYKKSK